MRLVDLDKIIDEIQLFGIWHEEKDLMPISYIREQIKGYEETMKALDDPQTIRIYQEMIHALEMLILYWRMQ